LTDARVLTVIDLAYQAATDPALWATTLEATSDVLGGSSAFMMNSGATAYSAARAGRASCSAAAMMSLSERRT
jgi:hypothetical protein